MQLHWQQQETILWETLLATRIKVKNAAAAPGSRLTGLIFINNIKKRNCVQLTYKKEKKKKLKQMYRIYIVNNNELCKWKKQQTEGETSPVHEY